MYWFGGARKPYFSVVIDSLGFFSTFCSGAVPDGLHRTPTPTNGRAFGGYVFGMGSSKSYVSENVGTVGELYKGKIMKKWGWTLVLIGSYPEW